MNKPEPGQMFIFYTKDNNKYEDWLADNYVWYNKGANKALPNGKPIVFKNYLIMRF